MSIYETAPYKVLIKEDHFELRQYDGFYTAAVEEDDLDGSRGFNQIFNYISGNNEARQKISMTTPVFNEMKTDSVTTEFVMPRTFTAAKPPQPDNANIRIKQKEARLVAAVKFSGTVHQKKLQQYQKSLLEWIDQQGKTPVGNFMLARYNPPFIPPFLRRNEVLIDILP